MRDKTRISSDLCTLSCQWYRHSRNDCLQVSFFEKKTAFVNIWTATLTTNLEPVHFDSEFELEVFVSAHASFMPPVKEMIY
jgi:hypothetical protein